MKSLNLMLKPHRVTLGNFKTFSFMSLKYLLGEWINNFFFVSMCVGPKLITKCSAWRSAWLKCFTQTLMPLYIYALGWVTVKLDQRVYWAWCYCITSPSSMYYVAIRVRFKRWKGYINHHIFTPDGGFQGTVMV